MCSHLFCRGRRPRRPVLKNIFNISGGASPSPTANLCLEVFLGNNAHCGGLHLITAFGGASPQGEAFFELFLTRKLYAKRCFSKKLCLQITHRRKRLKAFPLRGRWRGTRRMRCSRPQTALSLSHTNYNLEFLTSLKTCGSYCTWSVQ